MNERDALRAEAWNSWVSKEEREAILAALPTMTDDEVATKLREVRAAIRAYIEYWRQSQ